MSKQGSKSSKKQKREVDSGSDDSDDDLQPIHFFVPGENINAAVLVEYVTQYVDRTAKITSSHHPTDKTRTGFNVLAKKTLNSVSLRDIISDSKDWDTETQSRKFRKNPYRYSDSDTARRRARQGASKGGTIRPAQPQRETAADPNENYSRQRPTAVPNPGKVPAQYGSHQPPQPRDFARTASTAGYFPGTSRADYGATYNIYNTMASTSYNTNISPSGDGSGLSYIPQVTKPSPDYPPPSYDQSTMRAPPRPQPPSQPDPDSFDQDDKPPTSQATNLNPLRPPGEEGSRPYSSQSRRPSGYEDTIRRSSNRG
ncbi:hypothetical protein HRR83_001686 [Exophiala dermatitidis]|uniref:Uncharacterized protein n=2 Tax=Exophiala dermatitidis TaxID=5970 RepID=H6C5P8_EXODN|nr:uncharacterized protein HMPREF1120_07044 [Exophiala dermatitidis NIH/UT8656]KAJ4516357.1 hypothetical protein HRR73_004820 [Exophiala dermatitidis]EHY59044.1 hypothetical protein HMPREF1120_07044 [Exophiala dermatitidis NIH/UT8656]KAJ4526492.1 hypothetical protein HRR74_001690 [Exophiala dermatitidis]KAJ4532262.1 hypothetical protein HRR76_007260 [Exophiala dermatitidis]KAJ4546299.1 hypothetical protein HRR77_004834 [Exophiala dermatitidis]